ncbi:hypothetical protein NODU109028_07600 [Nocardioides dubius]|uniref:VOC domain-containing protein n=1 Tax=Nocardioides dubius TaxID=317019 RepID=A0ABP4EJK0_9ACTN
MSTSRIYGPLISTASPGEHERQLVDVFAMTAAAPTELSAPTSADLFGVPGPIRLQAFATPGVEAGAVLCRFAEPGAPIREEHSRVHRDALRVVDFYAPDFDEALAHAASAGFAMQAAEASYETNEGGFREAHRHGPDGVVTAFLHGDRDFFADFAEVRDLVLSEPVSISLPLSDAGPTVAWYRQVFGWGVVYEYDFVDASFSALMGVGEELRVRSVTIGPSRQQTYVNVVDYGVGAGLGGSLAGHGVAPRRGLLGLVVLADDVEQIARAALGAAGPIVEVDLPGFGSTRALVVAAPFGAPHLVIERSGR